MIFEILKEEDLDFNDFIIRIRGFGFIISFLVLYFLQGIGFKQIDMI